MSQARLAALAKEAPERVRPAMERVVERRAPLQARYLVGRVVTMCLAAALYGNWLLATGLERTTMITLGIGSLLLFTIVLDIACALGRWAADWVIPTAAIVLRPLELVLAPIALVTSAVTQLPRWRRRANPRLAETEVEMMVDQSERAGNIEQEPAELIRNVLEFSELTARDAMVPRKRMIGIKADTPLEAVVRTVTETGHSRYPIYREDLDDIIALLCAKDLFRVMNGSWRPPPNDAVTPLSVRMPSLNDIVREPVKYVAESQPLASLLREMRQERQHLAVVVDEYGGTSGLVTLEDVLEEIVGDIQDEYDMEDAPIVDLGHGRLIADAAVLVSDLSAYLGSDLDPEGQYDSLGGMLTDKLGSVPAIGTSIPADGLRFIVRESDEKHIAKVEIVRARPSLADTSGPHSAAE